MSNYIGSSDEALAFMRSIHVRDRLIMDLVRALHIIDSNAAESPEWIRRVTREAIEKVEQS